MTAPRITKADRLLLATAEYDRHAQQLIISEIGNGAAGLIEVIEYLATLAASCLQTIGGNRDVVVQVLEQHIAEALDYEHHTAGGR